MTGMITMSYYRGKERSLSLPIAEVFERMEDARTKGVDLWENDGRHLNFEGCRIMTRAVLDAMNYKEVPVPGTLNCSLLPGTIAAWKILMVDGTELPLTTERVAALQPNDSWRDLTGPSEEPQQHWWQEQERSRGFAISLNSRYGGGHHIAIAEVPSEARGAYINTGADIKAVWLNRKRLPVEPHGWHAGNNRILSNSEQARTPLLLNAATVFS
jgi:hypothetical protein